MYLCIVLLGKRFFHIPLKLLVLIFCSLRQISPKACYEYSQYLEGDIYHLASLLGFLRLFRMLEVSLIVCESSFLSRQSICTSSFCRSTLSILISVIHSLGFRVMSYSLLLANVLHSLVLDTPVVGSICIESFVHTSLASSYLLALSLILQ